MNEGLLALCQMAVGEKLGNEPAAQRLFDNLLNYCASYKRVERRAALAVQPDTPLARLIDSLNLQADKTADPLAAMADGRHQIVVADASPEMLGRLAARRDAVNAFARKGGWLMLWGLDPKGLADFNKLVGVEHFIRPFRMERVTLAPVRDLLVAGLTMRDVAMEGQRMYDFAGDKFAAGDAFSFVVDMDDIAPFCAFPPPDYFKITSPENDKNPFNMVNGFASDDSWKYVFSLDVSKGETTRFTLKLPRGEEITEFSVVFNAFYHKVTKFRLTFNEDASAALALAAVPGNDRQDYPLKPARKAESVTIEMLEWTESATPVVGIDNLWIKVKRSDEFRKKVVPLLNIGGLVKYPIGEGGIVLNELNIGQDAKSDNEVKKRNIAGMLLRNMGAAMSAE